ncbi:mas-related G-protein coupled receptor member H-like [Elgaria multicarinata webbii]|uniref:mas-related G-protein coupled receptor member H-like n=1 Tax=Elgaria multicarinata webbii TaxID=159646 RepID=UPI002FCCE7F4
MANLSLTMQCSWDDILEIFNVYSTIALPTSKEASPQYSILASVILLICLSGLVGNGTVIWIIGFHIKRNSFTTCIVNLAVADFGVLIALVLREMSLILIADKQDIALHLAHISFPVLLFMHTAGQLLLTAISIDKCVAVIFPIWHRCHRPPKLSTLVCAFLWFLSFMFCGIHVLLVSAGQGPLFLVIVNVLICYPLMAISTLTVFVKIRFKQHQRKRTKRSKVILLTLFSFLTFSFPLNLCIVIGYYYFLEALTITFEIIATLCASLNSSVNPVLYFLAGRETKVHCRVSRLKVALQKIFKDEEDCRDDEEPPV